MAGQDTGQETPHQGELAFLLARDGGTAAGSGDQTMNRIIKDFMQRGVANGTIH
jgi:hypothetical protein